MTDWDDEPDQFDDDWPDEREDWDRMCQCGRQSSGDACEQCGAPLCHMCSELGANFCKGHPTADYRPNYADAYEDPIAVYADGGVIGRNPSEVGGTWAWCHVDAAGERVMTASGVVQPWASMPVITNNLTEMIALVLGLEALPAGWTGTVYSDSRITLGRLFQGWRMDGIPAALQRRARAAVARLGPCDWTLLDGHPTQAQLAAGKGKRGGPVSAHNVWADKACGEQAKLARRSYAV